MTIFGEKISQPMSRVSKTLDVAVCPFCRRKLSNVYRTFIFDGIILSQKAPLRRSVLMVLEIDHNSKKVHRL